MTYTKSLVKTKRKKIHSLLNSCCLVFYSYGLGKIILIGNPSYTNARTHTHTSPFLCFNKEICLFSVLYFSFISSSWFHYSSVWGAKSSTLLHGCLKDQMISAKIHVADILFHKLNNGSDANLKREVDGIFSTTAKWTATISNHRLGWETFVILSAIRPRYTFAPVHVHNRHVLLFSGVQFHTEKRGDKAALDAGLIASCWAFSITLHSLLADSVKGERIPLWDREQSLAAGPKTWADLKMCIRGRWGFTDKTFKPQPHCIFFNVKKDAYKGMAFRKACQQNGPTNKNLFILTYG